VSIDVVLVTYNSSSFLERLSETLSATEMVSSVTVVDNDSSDASVELAHRLDWGTPVVQVISSPTNIGFGAAMNLGVRSVPASSKHLLLINPDVAVDREALSTLVAELDRNERLACVGASLSDSEGHAVSSARELPTRRSIALRRVAEVSAKSHGSTQAGWICGALMLWRKEAFDETGGFSADYFLYYEDTDICRRAQQLGYSVALVAGANAIHDQGHGEATTPALRKWNRQSRRRYARNWLGLGGVLAALAADAGDWLGSARRKLGRGVSK